MNHDQQLKADVLAELDWEPSVTQAHIGVTAKNGVVTLLGHVGSYMEKYAAERAAYRVKGVKAVAEELKVELADHFKRTDEDIAAAALSRIQWSVAVPSDAVKVKVENGWVTLTGNVEWKYQKDNAASDIRALMGVVGVSNEIAVRPKVDAKNMKDNIMHALHRSWFDPNQIKVKADEGEVTLTGTVHSWPDYDLASSTAWSAPGTTSVQNNIAVA